MIQGDPGVSGLSIKEGGNCESVTRTSKLDLSDELDGGWRE